VPYPILLVVCGIGLGYVPDVPALQMPPNIVMRRILRLLDFEAEEIAILEMAGHSDLDEDDGD
jgi:hypothetical protein